MSLKSLLIGLPLPERQESKERLTKIVGLAILSSDALSSVAYATEEILSTLLLTGPALLGFSLPIAIAIALLIFIVAISYYQTLYVFPNGGGAYVVSKNYLGRNASLLAGASLMIDYVMTVTVSVTAGMAAITSAFPVLYGHRETLCLVCILILTLLNLRGVRESGKVFCVPVYVFIGSLLLMIGFGYFRVQEIEQLAFQRNNSLNTLAFAWIMLRSFASGCVALTGIEAVANSVQVFKPPEWRNARITLLWMAALLAVLFIGISYLANYYEVLPVAHETVLSQVARTTFGKGAFYYIIQFSTCLILVFAANTSFAGFPRLSSMMAADGFLPKQLTTRGDRLVYSNGILLLSLFAALLILIFRGHTSPLIPLYTVGVFVAFTLSQTGMVRHWVTTKNKGWIKGICINGLGAVTTALVSLVVATTKFIHGAWIVLVAIPILIWVMRRIYAHYVNVNDQLDPQSPLPLSSYQGNISLVPVSGYRKTSVNAVNYAKMVSQEVRAVYVSIYPEMTKAMKKEWQKHDTSGTPLVLLESPNRSLIEPLLAYIDSLQKENKDRVIAVVLPTLVPVKWWHQLLHNQTTLLLRMLLLFKRNVVTINVPTHLQEGPDGNAP